MCWQAELQLHNLCVLFGQEALILRAIKKLAIQASKEDNSMAIIGSFRGKLN